MDRLNPWKRHDRSTSTLCRHIVSICAALCRRFFGEHNRII